ncbi:hypothetical protein pb186bvf_003676 [Paramecium bursaria]
MYWDQNIAIMTSFKKSQAIKNLQMKIIKASSLLKNYGPSQIFQKENTQELKKVRSYLNKSQILSNDHVQIPKNRSQTFGVEQRDYCDKVRLNKKKVYQNPIQYSKPMFKIDGQQRIQKNEIKNEQIYPATYYWNTPQLGQVNTGQDQDFDKNYSKIRKYLEGQSQILTVSDDYQKHNKYKDIVENSREFSQHIDEANRTSSNAHASGIERQKVKRSSFQQDWINRGKEQRK